MMLGTPVVVEEIDDPDLAASLLRQREKVRRNLAVFDAHAPDLFARERGRVIAVAGGQLHVAETAEAAWEWVKTTHPDDEGVFVHYIPREKGWRVYADPR